MAKFGKTTCKIIIKTNFSFVPEHKTFLQRCSGVATVNHGCHITWCSLATATNCTRFVEVCVCVWVCVCVCVCVWCVGVCVTFSVKAAFPYQNINHLSSCLTSVLHSIKPSVLKYTIYIYILCLPIPWCAGRHIYTTALDSSPVARSTQRRWAGTRAGSIVQAVSARGRIV